MTAPLPRVIAFGASISCWSFESKGSKGFGDVLKKHFEGRADVENEGYPGGTSETLKPIFARLLTSIRAQPTRPIPLFTIFIGANDAVVGPSHVPIDRYAANIRSFIDAILTDGSPAFAKTRIILITPPPINCSDPLSRFTKGVLSETQEKVLLMNLEKTAREGHAWKTWVAKLRYAERIVQVAGSYPERVFAVDAWRALTQHGLFLEGREEGLATPLDVDEGMKWLGCGLPGAGVFGTDVLVDGLHFGEKGDELLSQEIMKIAQDL